MAKKKNLEDLKPETAVQVPEQDEIRGGFIAVEHKMPEPPPPPNPRRDRSPPGRG